MSAYVAVYLSVLHLHNEWKICVDLLAYEKAFDSVKHQTIVKLLSEKEICIIRNYRDFVRELRKTAKL